jgi:cell division protein FtsB
MVRRILVGFFAGLNHLLQTPQKVIWICLGLIMLNMVIDGSLFRLWGLHRDYQEIQNNIQSLEQQNQKLKMQLEKARDPAFLEREARDRFDLVSEGDLVFVFSEEEGP